MSSSGLKVLVVILSAGMVVVSGLYIDLFYRSKEQGIEHAREKEELEALAVKYGQLAELIDLCTPPSTYPFPYDVVIRSGCRLQFKRGGGERYQYQGPTASVFYNWLENSTLELDLTILYPKPGLYVPLTLQMGNAFLKSSTTVCEEMDGYSLCHAPIFWEMNATESGKYTVLLPVKGWYTISLLGKITMQLPGGGIASSLLIGSKWVNGTWVTIEGV